MFKKKVNDSDEVAISVESKRIYKKGKVHLTVPQYEAYATLLLTNDSQYLSLSPENFENLRTIFREMEQ